MAHGVTNQITDSFTGNGIGQTFTIPLNVDPQFPVRAHVVSVVTITGTVTGAVLTYDVQAKDGIFVDSGQPSISIAGATGSVFRYDAFISTGSIKGFRTRVSGWTGGTNASVVTTVIYLI